MWTKWVESQLQVTPLSLDLSLALLPNEPFTAITRRGVEIWERSDPVSEDTLLKLGSGIKQRPSYLEHRALYSGLIDDRIDLFIGLWLVENTGYESLSSTGMQRTLDAVAVGEILTTMDPNIRRALFSGELWNDYERSPSLQLAIERHQRRARDSEARKAMIYVKFLMNRSDSDGK